MSLNLKNKDRLLLVTQNISLFFLLQVILLRTFVSAQGFANVHLCLIFSWSAFTFLVMYLLLQQQYICKNIWLHVTISLLVMSVLLSMLFCRDMHQAQTTMMVWTADICTFFCCYFWGKQQQNWRILFFAILCVFCVEITYGFYQYYFELPALKWQIEQNIFHMGADEGKQQLLEARILSLQAFAHFPLSNNYGTYLVMYSFVVMGLFYKVAKTKRNIVLILSLAAICIINIYITKSRGAILAMIAVGGIMFLAYSFSHKKKLFYLASALTGVAAIVAYFLMTTTSYLDVVGNHSLTFLSRMGYWQTTIPMFSQHSLFGIGVDNFSQHFYQYKPLWLEEVNNAHNFYLQFAVETGIMGTISLLLFGVVFVKALCSKQTDSTSQNDHTPKRLFFCSALVACLYLFVTQSLAMSNSGEEYLQYLFGNELILRALFYGVIAVGIVLLYIAILVKKIPLSIVGLRMALLAFAIHACIDTHFYTYNLSQHFWIVFGLYAARISHKSQHIPKYLYVLCLSIALLFVLYLTILSPQNSQQNHFAQLVKIQQTNEVFTKKSQKYYEFLQRELRTNSDNADAHVRMALLLIKSLQIQIGNIPHHKLRLSKVAQKIIEIEQHITIIKETKLKIFNAQQLFYREVADIWEKLQQSDKQQQALRQAAQCSQKALVLYPTSSYFLFVHAQILDALGESKEAFSFYKKALWCSDMIFPATYGLNTAQKKIVMERLAQKVK
ncbi:O-antigen ligase family protein [Candidatus Uabimicrobium amorphum]|uniref:Exopolysaccharide biosynthesis protein n=1 Tax=Uabimicrobium amorphum TaxID=2596890 RepID=A0A5S9F706_UABAM|nr:O-antigen ligase family protein [Candidatus Uabimicrobium amorphum]BBM87693.1 exopolysaccharide biosynthesis protein [Candidatus Uabimicrobium amorphum]